jgi:hypothetical protein
VAAPQPAAGSAASHQAVAEERASKAARSTPTAARG